MVAIYFSCTMCHKCVPDDGEPTFNVGGQLPGCPEEERLCERCAANQSVYELDAREHVCVAEHRGTRVREIIGGWAEYDVWRRTKSLDDYALAVFKYLHVLSDDLRALWMVPGDAPAPRGMVWAAAFMAAPEDYRWAPYAEEKAACPTLWSTLEDPVDFQWCRGGHDQLARLFLPTEDGCASDGEPADDLWPCEATITAKRGAVAAALVQAQANVVAFEERAARIRKRRRVDPAVVAATISGKKLKH